MDVANTADEEKQQQKGVPQEVCWPSDFLSRLTMDIFFY